MGKPVIIDYPEDRTRLKEEFGKMAATEGFAESVAMAKEVLHGKPKKKKKVSRKQQTIKVVINDCHGGFGLSNAAVEECVKRGMKLTKYGPDGNYDDEDADFCESSSGRRDKYTCCKDSSIEPDKQNAFRTNPILVSVVRKLGEKASGCFAKLKIIKIPFPSTKGWCIEEYDGAESVCENHRTWG